MIGGCCHHNGACGCYGLAAGATIGLHSPSAAAVGTDVPEGDRLPWATRWVQSCASSYQSGSLPSRANSASVPRPCPQQPACNGGQQRCARCAPDPPLIHARHAPFLQCVLPGFPACRPRSSRAAPAACSTPTHRAASPMASCITMRALAACQAPQQKSSSRNSTLRVSCQAAPQRKAAGATLGAASLLAAAPALAASEAVNQARWGGVGQLAGLHCRRRRRRQVRGAPEKSAQQLTPPPAPAPCSWLTLAA